MDTDDPHGRAAPAPLAEPRPSLRPVIERRVAAVRELETFASLLCDDSPVVRREVARELERRGKRAHSMLRKLARHGEPKVRARANELLVRAARTVVVRRMIALACRERVDLEQGLLLMCRFREPHLDLRPYLLAIDAMAAEVSRRIEARGRLDGRAKILSDYLGRELGYRGDPSDYHHPDNVYLHRAIVRKRGLPLTLTALYLLVARRANVRAAAVALPGHVVLRIYDDDERSTLVDPFSGGTVLSQRDCMRYLADAGLPFEPSWFDDGADGALWLRHLNNLVNSCRKRGRAAEVRLLELLISVAQRRMSSGPTRASS